MYKLTTSSGDEFNMPDAETIRRVIDTLPLPDDGFSFLILDRGPDGDHFVQAAGNPAEGFILEYQEGGIKAHYECTKEGLSAEQVFSIFKAYSEQAPEWKAQVEWRKRDL